VTALPTYASLRDTLRQEILSGKLAAGTRLTAASVVERFGYSQMPVREALQALQGEGLIDIQPHKGASVLPLDARRVRNIYDTRAAIECLLVRLSVPNLTNSAMARLAAIHEDFTAASQSHNVEAIFNWNNAFHDLIYRHADNDESLVIYDRYAILLGSLRGTHGYSADRLAQMVTEHETILQALRRQDVPWLEATTRAHVEGARDDLLQRMADGRDTQFSNDMYREAMR